jgi:hypothetical protein
MALDLLKKNNSPKEVVSSLVAEFDLSTRQAYRYLQQAHRTRKPLALPEPKTVFTVKLPRFFDTIQYQSRTQRAGVDCCPGSRAGQRRYLCY